MSNGKGAAFADSSDSLANEPFLAIAHLDGNPREARIRLAAPITRAEISALYEGRIVEAHICQWDKRAQVVDPRHRTQLGSLVLEDRPWKNADPASIARAATDGVRGLGLDCLPWAGAAQRLRDRVAWLRAQGVEDDFPDFANEALFENIEVWLTPYLTKIRKRSDFEVLMLESFLKSQLSWDQQQTLDRLAPEAFMTPAGSKAKIEYSDGTPTLEVRIQEMFGETHHPSIYNKQIPLLIRFLSPARRPVQVTSDLVGFWKTSYRDVRKDLRGRYPRHPWPEDPLAAPATSRTKPRK